MAHQALSGDPSPYLLTAALAMMGLPAASYAGDLLQRKASELNKKEKRDPR